MEKPASLRKVLTEAFKQFKENPDKLFMWIESGDVLPVADNLSFTSNYSLKVAIEDFAGDERILWAVINNWIQTNQFDLLRRHNGHAAYKYMIEVVDDEKSDIEVTLEFSEGTIVEITKEGEYLVKKRPEPDRLNFFKVEKDE